MAKLLKGEEPRRGEGEPQGKIKAVLISYVELYFIVALRARREETNKENLLFLEILKT